MDSAGKKGSQPPSRRYCQDPARKRSVFAGIALVLTSFALAPVAEAWPKKYASPAIRRALSAVRARASAVRNAGQRAEDAQTPTSGARLTFYGGAGGVTGSMHMLEANGHKILVDCGLYQGERNGPELNKTIPKPATQADCLLLTHAHVDHSGRIPLLVKKGFEGKVYCAPGTYELCEELWLDSAKIQRKNAERHNRRTLKRLEKKGDQKKLQEFHPIEPLYTEQDVRDALTRFVTCEFEKPFDITPNISACIYPSGHIPGAGSFAVDVRSGGMTRRIAFSGDIGKKGSLLLDDPVPVPNADYVVMESTYGKRIRESISTEERTKQLVEVIAAAKARGGHLIIPSFSLQRAQQLLHVLKRASDADEGLLKDVRVILDTPLGVKITNIFRRNLHLFSSRVRRYAEKLEHGDPFSPPNLEMVLSWQERDALREELRKTDKTAIVISAAGMCHAGPVQGHLADHIGNKKNTIAFVGYQCPGTLGQRIRDAKGRRKVKIVGEEHRVLAQIVDLKSFSGHADQLGLREWAEISGENAKRFYIVHGEPKESKALQKVLRRPGREVTAPLRGESFKLWE